MCCSVCIAKSQTQVAFGQGNSSYARSFGVPKSSSGIGGRYLSSLIMTLIANSSEKLDLPAGCVSKFYSLF